MVVCHPRMAYYHGALPCVMGRPLYGELLLGIAHVCIVWTIGEVGWAMLCSSEHFTILGMQRMMVVCPNPKPSHSPLTSQHLGSKPYLGSYNSGNPKFATQGID